MKKSFLFTVLFLLSLNLWSLQSLVKDDCGLLSNHEIEELQERASRTAQTYNCGIYIYVVKSMDDFVYDYEVYQDAFGIEAFAQYLFF